VLGQPRQDDLIAYLIEQMPAESAHARLAAARIDLQPPALQVTRVRMSRATVELVSTVPQGVLGRAIAGALDRYSLVIGQDEAKRGHPVAEAMERVGRCLDGLDLVGAPGRTSWIAYFEEQRRWIDVPAIWLRDERQRVHKADDLTVQLLLDADRNGAHAVLASDWGYSAGFVARRSARAYTDARRTTLRPILTRLAHEGFEPEPSYEYLPIGVMDEAHGVVLAARFYGRNDLADDGSLLAGLARLLAAYEEAYRSGTAHPTREERQALT
jgi:hypothetical protein